MVTDQQVVLLRQKLMEGKGQQAAAAASGMSVRAARTWQRGRLPSEKKGKRRCEPDRALGLLLEAGTPFDYAAVRELAAPALHRSLSWPRPGWWT